MSIENESDLLNLQKIGRIVANCLQLMGSKLEPGITTREIDEIGKIYLDSYVVMISDSGAGKVI
jgi:methionyl aminopeptidase